MTNARRAAHSCKSCRKIRLNTRFSEVNYDWLKSRAGGKPVCHLLDHRRYQTDLFWKYCGLLYSLVKSLLPLLYFRRLAVNQLSPSLLFSPLFRVDTINFIRHPHNGDPYHRRGRQRCHWRLLDRTLPRSWLPGSRVRSRARGRPEAYRTSTRHVASAGKGRPGPGSIAFQLRVYRFHLSGAVRGD